MGFMCPGCGCACNGSLAIHTTRICDGFDAGFAFVNVTRPDSSVVACNTNGGGTCTSAYTQAGTYTIDVLDSGSYYAKTVLVTATCTTQAVTIPLVLKPNSFKVQVAGCGLLNGATVTGTGPGGYSGTWTTSGAGQTPDIFVPGPGPAVYTFTSTPARCNTGTATVTLGTNNCTQTPAAPLINVTPATGYACAAFCQYPISKTLFLTDPVWGVIPLTYNATTTNWEGGATGTAACISPGNPNNGKPLDLGFTLQNNPGGSVVVTYVPQDHSNAGGSTGYSANSITCYPSAVVISGTVPVGYFCAAAASSFTVTE